MILPIDQNSPVPLYDQIKAALKGLVATGALRPGDPVPSIRSLAVELELNPNTVARAFRELATEGFLESRRGEGATISPAAKRQARDGLEDVRASLRDAVLCARRNGLSWPEVRALIKEVEILSVHKEAEAERP